MIKTKVTDVMSKVISGGEGCIGWMTNIVVTGGERYKSESMSGGVRVNIISYCSPQTGTHDPIQHR